MGKNNSKKKRKKKSAAAAAAASNNNNDTKAAHSDDSVLSSNNFVTEAGPGCYIARRDLLSRRGNNDNKFFSDWVLEWEDVDLNDFEYNEEEDDEDDKGGCSTEVPELAIDPDEKTLSVCNTRRDAQAMIAYITLYTDNDNNNNNNNSQEKATCSTFQINVIGRNGHRLQHGTTTNNDAVKRNCITFIVLCPPKVFVHLCRLEVVTENYKRDFDLFQDLELESDVQVWNQHPNPTTARHDYPLGFPLQYKSHSQQQVQEQNSSGDGESDRSDGFLCTQGVGGQLTHFFSGNLHAIDFRAPCGTPIVAVANGTVIESKDDNTLTGIAVSNLFQWNTIMIQVDTTTTTTKTENREEEGEKCVNTTTTSTSSSPLFVEYVHIQKSFVKEGDRVTKGQVIGESGSVGFSPEPHLHFAAYLSKEPTAPTVQVQFQSAKDNDENVLFLPKAGRYYNVNGEVVRR